MVLDVSRPDSAVESGEQREFKAAFLGHLGCANCAGRVGRVSTRDSDKAAVLICSTGHMHPVIGGVPRFEDDESYAGKSCEEVFRWFDRPGGKRVPVPGARIPLQDTMR